MGDELLAEYNGATLEREYGYRGGQLLLVANQTSLGFYYQFNMTDHLGSTRMSVTDTGSLTNLVRRDFLPYGEELTAGVGLRGTAGGYYGGNDPMRQKFTGYERDVEINLDFAQARYMNNSQGRFTSVDPLLSSGTIYDPRSWNRYSHTVNNPLKYTDPAGLYIFSQELGGADTDEELIKNRGERAANRIIERRNKIRDTFTRAANAANSLDLTDEQRSAARRAVNAYGSFRDGEKDNVIVGLVGNRTSSSTTNGNNSDGTIVVNLNLDVEGRDGAVTLAHEGSHVADFQDYESRARNGQADAKDYDITQFETERRAFFVSSYIAQGLGLRSYYPNQSPDTEVWNQGWSEDRRAVYRGLGVLSYIFKNYEAFPGGGVLSPGNPGFKLSASP